jgi:vacuolar-type H+-ATPase subunit H
MSFEEIRNLVQKEKEAEQKLAETREEAAKIIQKAEEDANKILQEAEKQDYDRFFKKKTLEIEENKKRIEEDTERKIETLTKVANKNMKKTISFIIDTILGE